MDADYSNMFSYPNFHTPTRRQRGVHVPPLDMKATTCFDQGLMTPLSANSHDVSRRNSDVETAWSDTLCLQNQSYSPGHPNTPVQGLPQGDAFDINQYDSIHIQITGDVSQHGSLPTPVACTPSYTSSFFGNGPMLGLNPPSSPDMLQQPTHVVNWSAHVPATNRLLPDSSFTSSTMGLSTFGNLDIGSASTASFSGSSYFEAPSTMSFSDGDMSTSDTKVSMPTLEQNPCIVPLQTLQDPTQYMSHEWHNDTATDNDYTTLFSQSSPAPQLLSPMSPAVHDMQFKVDSYLSGSPERKSSLHRTPSKSCVTPRRHKKKQVRRGKNNQITYKGCTQDGAIVDCVVEHKAMKKHLEKHLDGVESAKTKKYRCGLWGTQCDKEFARSEHQKRHMWTHDPARRFPCLIEDCQAGAAKTGAVNRNDNANDHAYTHIRSWLGSEGAAKVAALCGPPGKKNKARNSAVDPRILRDRILDRTNHDPEKYLRFFNTFNRKASDEYGVHIDFLGDDCEMTRCERQTGRCRVCEQVRKTSRR